MATPVVERSADEEAHVPELRHVPGLDGLRGLAVAGVLLFHAGHLEGGFLGVDLFFVLSGFLITSLLLREAEGTGRVSLSGFWVRRARRLLPALAGLLIGVAAYARFVADPSELTRIRGDGIATIAYVANWRAVFAHHAYWDLFSAPSPLQHMWSIAIEEQFYLLWPLVIVGLLRWRGRARLASSVLVTALVLAAVSLAAMVLLYDPSDNTRVYFGTDTRAASILLGVALAAWIAVRGPVASSASGAGTQAVGLVGAGVLAYAWTHTDGSAEWLYRGGMFGLAVAAVAVIAAVSAPRPGVLHRALSVSALRALGLISYGTYLWHWPVYLVLAPDRIGIDGWPLVVVRISVTLVVATASYVVVEQPIRRGTLRRIDLRLAAPVATVAVAVALVLATSGATSAAPVGEQAFPDSLPDAITAVDAAPAGAERVMVTGNSVGLYLGHGMKALATGDTMVVANRSNLGCTFPLPDDIRLGDGQRFPQGMVDCTTSWRDDVRALRPDLVVVALNDPGDADHLHEGRWLHPCMPEYDTWLESSWHRAIDVLSATGATVVVATPGYAETMLAPAVRIPRTDCVNAVIRRVADARPEAVVADVARHVCPGVPCRREVDGITLREDGLHYSGEGGLYMADWILDQGRRAIAAQS